MSALPIIAISIGDPNGIGVEIILKAFSNPAHFHHCIPVVFAHLDFMEQQQEHFNTTAPLAEQKGNPKQGLLYVASIWKSLPKVSFGEQSPLAGKAAFESLEAAVKPAGPEPITITLNGFDTVNSSVRAAAESARDPL